MVSVMGCSFSLGPIVRVVLVEIFPSSILGKAMSIAILAQWILNFVVTLTFAILDGSAFLNRHFSHGFAYWLYSAGALLAALFVVRFVPETKGRTLESIQHLRRPSESRARPPSRRRRARRPIAGTEASAEMRSLCRQAGVRRGGCGA
jgi:SP family xylose:H+ symportor-like MFS transporter